ncbi:MAG: D-alanyl-D-alanine carboxypeptidase [Rhodospirillaceae bacterium]|nr:D-alanyl-D-alanine carboxypeptidase [Rhodospirillaceae bacterium]MBL6932192.1 D-alanyl-D-alanine carboxypeptidase [Rhodospirillales bacterium]
MFAVRYLQLFAAAVVLAALPLLTPTPAQAKYASYVIDAETGAVLHKINEDTLNYPASLTKMMTLYMVFDALEKGSIRMDTPVEFSARAARQPSSKLGLSRGEKLTFEQAILAIVTKSANDVATAIAETLSGTERKFALSMTAKARAIGMGRTTFRNASGLPHRGQLSTARDMATLAMRLLRDFPQHYHYFSTKTFEHDGLTHKNHNELLKTYHGADGIKTGYIRASGFNLVASVERDGQRLIGVVFGGRTSRARNKHMAKLLDKGYEKLGTTHTEVAVEAKISKKARDREISKLQWGIQVGAYKTTDPAYKIAQLAVEKAPDYLFEGHIRVVPLEKGERSPVYRARILGLTKQQAYKACRVLKRRNINCMELKMKQPLQQLAAAD